MSDDRRTINEAQVIRRCGEMGLSIQGVEQRGTILILEPVPDERLPSPRILERLADELSDQVVRYVGIDLPTNPIEEQADEC